MSMMGGRFPQGPDDTGHTVAEFTTYEAAQKAVSTLIAADIPARDISVVGNGLRSVERVTGRLGYATAARSGAVNGLLLGLLFAAIFVLGSPTVQIQAFVGVLFVGIAIGMLLSLVTFSIVRRRRDYASVTQVVAENYAVHVLSNSIHRARQVLGTVPATPASAPAATEAAPQRPGPPQYGERVAPDSSEPPKYGQRVAPAVPDAESTDAADEEGAPPDPDAPTEPDDRDHPRA
ncbi:general stress protein [Microbacterium sp. BWT-B31]|uniref:general stress protein n=1 Tax=Microbacterium sp. BWT-B31 TaxID=3232072 RepID=UPI003526CB1A